MLAANPWGLHHTGKPRRHHPTYRVWVVLGCNALAVKQEAHARDVFALAIAERVHELSKGRSALNLEEDLVVVVGNLDIQVLALTTIFGLLLNIWGTVVGHFGGFGGLGFGQRSGCA
jgi:hypothetical protein